jgi:rhodanese-related sulfurtransferase
MRLYLSHLRAAVFVFAATALTTALADAPIPITADEAFDVVMDPDNQDVALVDLRDPVEFYWSGAPVSVTQIHFVDEKKAPVLPDNGKVRLVEEGKFLEYAVDGRHQRTQVTKIGQLDTEQIAINIPFKIGVPGTWVTNPKFLTDMNRLHHNYGINVVILYCRTGGRSSSAGAAITTPFTQIYEIDDPNDPVLGNMHGGFSGSTYGGVYAGHIGFPGRQTDRQVTPSVSWLDSGLPIATQVQPIQLPDEEEP